MPLINCEIELIAVWSAICVIISTKNANQVAIFVITGVYYSYIYVPVVTLSIQNYCHN